MRSSSCAALLGHAGPFPLRRRLDRSVDNAEVLGLAATAPDVVHCTTKVDAI